MGTVSDDQSSDFFPIFLSVVFVIRNHSELLEQILSDATEKIAPLVSDYELIVVDNGSTDNSIIALKKLANNEKAGLPNLQVYALTKEVDTDTASWVGLENALGDFVAVLDPLVEDVAFLSEMLEQSVNDTEVVFARNLQNVPQNYAYQISSSIFNTLYKLFSGIHLANEAPQYRVLNRSVVNFILQHPQPAMTYRHLPATGGFSCVNQTYSTSPKAFHAKKLGDSIDKGVRLLVSTTRIPMRIVTSLSLFGAAANLLYSIYVVIIGLFKADVAPGWISLSLQQSGMFFLISLVLLVLGEYILQMASVSNKPPPYNVNEEFHSVRFTKREKLNIEEISTNPSKLY
ncbi:MAG: glycosyltransferase [Pseudomonadota bacterium]